MAIRRRVPILVTTGEVMRWLHRWDNAHLISPGAFPARPWRRTSPRDLESVADSLMKLRAIWSGRLGSGDTSAESGGVR